MTEYVIPLDKLCMNDVGRVGGKNASLGEMLQNLAPLGVAVPSGFATTADAYREFLKHDGLQDQINELLRELNVDDVVALQKAGKTIREWIMTIPYPEKMEAAIDEAYEKLVEEYGTSTSWAVRSSATAEDLPDASFAGQQETFLNVSGLDHIKFAIREVFASLFNDRAIAYRDHQGFEHSEVALSAGIQKMVRSDIASAGVAFTLDTESGFRDVVFITGSYGLGEMVVQGAVNPDEFYVHKTTLTADRPAVLRRTLGQKALKMVYSGDAKSPVKTVDVDPEERLHFCLNDEEIESLARMAMIIEKHYQRPMDIEWAKDGNDGQIYIVQARPETVESRSVNVTEQFILKDKGELLARGRAIGRKIGSGRVRILSSLDQMDQFEAGDVLLTDMTDPDWEPIMKKAAAIITNRGGRTCHAAIIARELGIPAVVGCGDATEKVAEGISATVSCAEGDEGYIYQGLLEFEHRVQSLDQMPELPVKIMMNVGNPDRAFSFSQLPNDGVGLARLEFIINNMIGIHPKALMAADKMDAEVQQVIREKTTAYGDPVEFYISRITEGVSTIAAAFYPSKVIVRMSDFKSNEYGNLVGGAEFEPHEENPMIGFRGAARYSSPEFEACFELECEAIKRVRDVMGLTNVEVMIPFVRTLSEAEAVIKILKKNGLERGKNGLRLIMMCELPSNAVLADQFLEFFDGFSIGSNDMTQLTLGLDRDSAQIAAAFDERDPAVLAMLEMAINACHKADKYVGICGQGPSDHPDLAAWLLERGISSISLNPDTVVSTWQALAKQ
ncbi:MULTISPECIES: phosphoenolpyruvate synthase [unclassified Methylophaga]|jgi:pyruvate, water dikinase|uniref:phosphoenolpyruvate synthase n=9 Tax=Methylophaga TaxID=40222 RepID=UPI000C36BF03|nr:MULTISPECIES: phosphoenolpyruvate synthase [unclassified Methylophaga]MAL48916.1 phosphoenolpyruvate synthase [Methylophaga sp.]MAP27302.1 phosphoenolpyruvate synthase [Methylophaga sp.]MBP25631.1 phosphoenolpyruvate synthase [Methylophaga sp.]HCC81609.1 phosphoenolpyruvate synthase [Methylophaga sp.]|tara:strand:+ start:1623 stop:3980 length:2358 start_codon:yes stop_codon:yes gene_type:complete